MATWIAFAAIGLALLAGIAFEAAVPGRCSASTPLSVASICTANERSVRPRFPQQRTRSKNNLATIDSNARSAVRGRSGRLRSSCRRQGRRLVRVRVLQSFANRTRRWGPGH